MPLLSRVIATILRKRVGLAAAFGVLVLGVVAFAVASPVFAQVAELQQVGASSGLPTDNIALIIARLIRAFLGVLGILFVCIVIYGGWLYMSSQGDPKKVETARKVLQNAVIGVIIIFSSFGITTYIIDRILNAAGLSGGGIAAIIAKYAEPLSGSLGAGIIETHYPARNATDIPRNTMIMVTFKEPMNLASLIDGYADDPTSTNLNAANVQIYQTAQLTDGVDAETIALPATGVVVSASEDGTSFVFDPVDLLGNATTDTNYTVVLGGGIETGDGQAAFTGAYSGGYTWTFEVSTEVDLTPPTVVSVIPRADESYDRNISVSLTFNEAMNPVAGTGTATSTGGFSNILISSDGATVAGTYSIGNDYKTIDFTPTDACGVDPCGDVIYCLPGDAGLSVSARAASVGADAPQAILINAAYDGLVDASGNSLDGNKDGIAQGSDTDVSETPDLSDDYAWDFSTTNDVCDEVPAIAELSHGILEGDADNSMPVTFTFSIPMKTTTLNSSNIQLWPDPWYEMWFSVSSQEAAGTVSVCGSDVPATIASIDHPTLVSIDDLGWNYYPVVTKDVKSAYQICMSPALGPASGTNTGSCDVSPTQPYCCNGAPSASACKTVSGKELPDTSN